MISQEVEKSFSFWGSSEGDSVHPAECMHQLLEQVRRHKVNIDGNVCTVMVTTLVLEVDILSIPRFSISMCTVRRSKRISRYISVRQVVGTRTARYRAVPPKIDHRRSIEGEIGHRRSIEGEIDRRRSIEQEKGRKKKRKKKKKKEKRRKKTYRPRAVLACVPSSPVGRQRPRTVVARGSRALFLPHEEKDRADVMTYVTMQVFGHLERGTGVAAATPSIPLCCT
ncbi:hypothetical protein GW17_00008446 [Ensete ventricosum]|nr:hypothetical protein GW17_00008446 [Ensete ventricosum]